MRDMDAPLTQDALDTIRLGDAQRAATYRKIETWRDEIKGGNVGIIEEILAAYPDADRRALLHLAKSTRRNGDGQKRQTSSKALFRYLKKISQR